MRAVAKIKSLVFLYIDRSKKLKGYSFMEDNIYYLRGKAEC